MSTNNPQFIISRSFNAPRELLWKAWNTPELMAKWFGPKGFGIGKYTMDMRPGGNYHYCMNAPDGSEMWGKFTYREISQPSKLVFENSFSDAAGGLTRHPMSPSWPLKLLSTIQFDEQAGGKTKVTITWSPIDGTPQEDVDTFAGAMEGMNQGWTGTFDQLEAFLAEQTGLAKTA